MASSDYRLCDVCDCKVFYDSHLNYNWNEATQRNELENLGAWVVVCKKCAEQYKIKLVKKTHKLLAKEGKASHFENETREGR